MQSCYQAKIKSYDMFFPYVMALDNSGIILAANENLVRRIQGHGVGKQFLDEFKLSIDNQSATESFEALPVHTLVRFYRSDGNFAFRGFFQKMEDEGHQWILFVGSAWAQWMFDQHPEIALGTNDFGVLDMQREFLAYGVTSKIMEDDLKVVAAKLRATIQQRDLVVADNSSKSAFVRSISHQIRTPLNAIAGAVDLLKQSKMRGRFKRYIQVADDAVAALSGVVEQALEFEGLEHANLQLDKVGFNLNQFLDKLVSDLQLMSAVKNVSITIDLSDKLPRDILSVQSVIKTALANFISNAIKYSSSSKVVVKARLVSDERILFEVEDYGIGISENEAQHLFTPFWKGQAGTYSNSFGAGLGLYIAKQLTERIGGTITFRSTPNELTVFGIEVPFSPASIDIYDDAESDETQSRIDRLKSSKFRILVVDDNPINREILEGMLKSLGCSVVKANDGDEAIARYFEYNPDIVLMDISMPILDGVSATLKIKELAGGKAAPIVAVTASASENDAKRYTDAGMAGLVSKPIRINKLVDVCWHQMITTGSA